MARIGRKKQVSPLSDLLQTSIKIRGLVGKIVNIAGTPEGVEALKGFAIPEAKQSKIKVVKTVPEFSPKQLKINSILKSHPDLETEVLIYLKARLPKDAPKQKKSKTDKAPKA